MVKRARITGWLIAAVTILSCGEFSGAARAQSLNCPTPQAMSGPGILRESPSKIAETGSFLASGEPANRVSEVIFDLRKRYPGTTDAEIENYLVTAYCPTVAKLAGLSVADQQTRVDQFARQARLTLYGH